MMDRPPTTAEKTDPRAGFSLNTAMTTWMQDIAPFGIFTTDQELRVTSWNQWLETHSGLAPDDVVGKSLLDVFPDVRRRQLHERFNRALCGEISVLSTALHQYLLPLRVTIAESGLPNMLQTARIAPLHDDNAIVGTITTIEDVTQREFQAAVLHRQQELDRLLSAALAALLQSTDPVKDIAEIFPRISPSLGLDAFVSYLLEPDASVLRLNAAGGISPKQRDALATLPVSESDLVAPGRLGVTIPATVEAHLDALRQIGLRGRCCFPLLISDRVIGLVSFGSYERETIAAADVNTLHRIAGYVAVALDRTLREREVVAASRAKDDFLAALSHELRTPLNPVLLLASDCALNSEYSASAREAFRVIEKNALLEARLIDDLLDLTRIEHGKLALEMQRLDVHGTLRDAIGTVRADASERELSLEISFAAEASVILGDSARLQQVFWNVLKNAIKFTPQGGVIRVSTRLIKASNEILIQIADTGVGIETHELGRIFGAFSQGDHAAQRVGHRFGGLGLGLAISRKLVELHSGRIEASSAGKGQGSTFTIHLPLVAFPHSIAPVSTISAGSPVDARTRTAEGPAKPVRRILLVEDHEPTREPLARLLVRRGYDVVPVGSVAAATAAAEAQPFDLVVSDIGLPDGDGFTLMRTLRANHGVKGIALTGYGMEKDVASSNDAGFVEHLTKPISVTMLEKALARAFEQMEVP